MTARERFARAAHCRPVDRPPVWLMRQAGRALPEYRKLKEKYTFVQLCQNPELAVEATLQPVHRFGFDAAILFSDILVIPEALGQTYHFRESGGVVMDFAVTSKTDIEKLSAERVAAHLGIFAGVLASDGVTNLTSTKKLALLKSRFGEFDYIGNSRADLPLLAGARHAIVANPSLGLRAALLLRRIPMARTFLDRRPLPRTLLKAIRVHQWAKNLLLLAPLLLSHKLNPAAIGAVAAAFFCFSFMASASYLVNDLLDIESDRHDPIKRFRPFAAGDLPVAGGAALALALIAASLAILPWLPRHFALWLAVYIVTTTAYSFYLKQVALVDVLTLSGLYTLRLLAGGAAGGTQISPWLAGFSIFLFLSLAMVKRFSELENLRERGVTAPHGRGYLVADLEQIRTFGTSSATAAVVVFSLYISRPDVEALYKHAGRLWLIVPLMLYWLYRVWLLGSRGEMDDDPVIFALRDHLSLLVGACVVAVAVSAL
jgi:4-hydroxybenzoate polyprenyltransferase